MDTDLGHGGPVRGLSPARAEGSLTRRQLTRWILGVVAAGAGAATSGCTPAGWAPHPGDVLRAASGVLPAGVPSSSSAPSTASAPGAPPTAEPVSAQPSHPRPTGAHADLGLPRTPGTVVSTLTGFGATGATGTAGAAVALTLDDGPHPRWTPQVLDLLAALDVTASFCVIGKEAAAHPDLVRRVAAAGHTVVNHSQDHPLHLASMDADDVDAQVSRAQDVIGDLLGEPPSLFRAPYGTWTPAVRAALARHGLTGLGWNVDPRDWSRPGAAAIEGSLLLAAAGDVLLCHDGGGDRSETLEALREVLPRLQQRGLRFRAVPR